MAELDPKLGLFHESFERWALRVRARLLARRMLAGAALGLTLGALGAALLWWQGQGPLRPWAGLLGLVGMLAGAVYGMRRRWSDTDVALYLDARLGAAEAISTAVELRSQAERGDRAREIVVRRAAELLTTGDLALARPRVLERWHSLVVLAAATVVALSIIPLPPAPPPPEPPPGSELVQIAELDGIERIVALEKLEGRDAAQQERLKRIAEEAKKLRADIAKGLEKREAQARIAKLRDEIAAEKLSLGNEKNRAGLEAALSKLAQNPVTKDAAKALGEGDLTAFDSEMQKLANLAEKESRDAAKDALKEAIRAAKERGAEEVAKSLEEQQKLFDERESGAEALRELAEALKGELSEEARKDLEEFGESGSPEARKRLSDSLGEALKGLSEEERKRLAENLKRRTGENGQANPMTKEQLEEMSKRLASPEGQKELAEQLKELANQDPSKEAERERALGEAEQGGAECQRQLGVPAPSEGPGGPGQGGKNGSSGKQQAGKGGPGSKKDDGKGDHSGQTAPVEAPELRSKAQAKINPGAPMQGSTIGRAPGRAGETANQKGSGALGSVGPTEVGGVERSEVPQEYREHVGRYFQP
jgi:hypothetical protein